MKPEPETIESLLLASGSRLSEAYVLLANQHHAGSTYLSGYVVEIILKLAYFKLKNYQYSDEITRSMRNPKLLIEDGFRKDSGEPSSNLHDLIPLFNLFSTYSEKIGKRFHDPAFLGTMRFHVHFVEQNWSTDLRYSPKSVDSETAIKLFQSVLFIFLNKSKMGVV